jgi:E3 ubiquitin-protein ligase EDD1
MQLAVRVRTKTTNRASNGGFIYIDPTSLRRTGAAFAAPASNKSVTIGTTASALARAFGIVLDRHGKKVAKSLL